jgi:ketosteroid isomerase-like protein
MPNTEYFVSYIAAYARKDLAAIESMFAQDVHLRDWNLNVHGKNAALAETAKNFAAANTIEIEILALYQADTTVAGELKIVVNRNNELHVVDVITFGSDGKILSIRAYIGTLTE